MHIMPPIHCIKWRAYRVIISSSRFVHFQVPIWPIITNLDSSRTLSWQISERHLQCARNLAEYKLDLMSHLRAVFITYPFNKITTIRVCIEGLIGLQVSCDLSSNFFSNPIIDWNWANLRQWNSVKHVWKPFVKEEESSYIQSVSKWSMYIVQHQRCMLTMNSTSTCSFPLWRRLICMDSRNFISSTGDVKGWFLFLSINPQSHKQVLWG